MKKFAFAFICSVLVNPSLGFHSPDPLHAVSDAAEKTPVVGQSTTSAIDIFAEQVELTLATDMPETEVTCLNSWSSNWGGRTETTILNAPRGFHASRGYCNSKTWVDWWITTSMPKLMTVWKVVLQGRGDGARTNRPIPRIYVTYTIKDPKDGLEENEVWYEYNKEGIAVDWGNWQDRDKIREVKFDRPFNAKKVRITIKRTDQQVIEGRLGVYVSEASLGNSITESDTKQAILTYQRDGTVGKGGRYFLPIELGEYRSKLNLILSTQDYDSGVFTTDCKECTVPNKYEFSNKDRLSKLGRQSESIAIFDKGEVSSQTVKGVYFEEEISFMKLNSKDELNYYGTNEHSCKLMGVTSSSSKFVDIFDGFIGLKNDPDVEKRQFNFMHGLYQKTLTADPERPILPIVSIFTSKSFGAESSVHFGGWDERALKDGELMRTLRQDGFTQWPIDKISFAGNKFEESQAYKMDFDPRHPYMHVTTAAFSLISAQLDLLFKSEVHSQEKMCGQDPAMKPFCYIKKSCDQVAKTGKTFSFTLWDKEKKNAFNMSWNIDDLLENGEVPWGMPNTCFFPIMKWDNGQSDQDMTLGNLFMDKYYLVMSNKENYDGLEGVFIGIAESDPEYLDYLMPLGTETRVIKEADRKKPKKPTLTPVVVASEETNDDDKDGEQKKVEPEINLNIPAEEYEEYVNEKEMSKWLIVGMSVVVVIGVLLVLICTCGMAQSTTVKKGSGMHRVTSVVDGEGNAQTFRIN